MLSFNDHDIYKDIIKSLLEANIQEKRYSVGSIVVLKSEKIPTLNNKVSFTADASTVFVKVELDTPSDETVGDGEPEVTLEVYKDVSRSKKIRTITFAQDPDSYFNHLVQGDGINWGKSTSTLETAQCIGVYYDGGDDWTTSKGRKKAEKEILSALSKGEDWNSKGKSNLISKLEKLPVGDFATLMDLIRGMNEFIEKIVKFSPLHIIHGSIDSGYKKNEAKNSLIQVSGVKDNTSDMIICNSSAGALTSAIEKESVTYDNAGICETETSKISFVQVSLKKSQEGAQLGKVTSALLLKHKIDPAMEIYRQVVEEEYDPDYVQYVNEGWLGDFVKKSFNTLKSGASAIGAKFINFIDGAKQLFKGWMSGLKKSWKQESASAVSDFSRLFKLNQRDVKKLTESFNTFIDTGKMVLSEETEESINDALRNVKSGDIGKFVKSIDRRASTLKSLYDKHWYLNHAEMGSGLQLSTIQVDFDMNVAIKLLANEVSLRTLQKIFTTNAGNINKLVDDMIDIQKEIYFGKTSLPLYKVYAKELDAGPSYKYLKTAGEFSAEKDVQIGPGKDLSYPISGFAMSSQGGKYYNIESWIITGVKNGISMYAQMRMGTNKAGAFSYVVEGTKVRDQSKYNKKFGIS